MITLEVVWLRAGEVRVGVAPRLGGRILSMAFAGLEYLWRNPALLDGELRPLVEPARLPEDAGFSAWQNWGGEKTWPAPQGWSGPGEWPGPPDAVLDAGAYRVVERADDRVVLESAYDDRTGLRIRRDISIAADQSVVVAATLTNRSSRKVRWAAWEVAQLGFSGEDVGHPESGVLVEVRGDDEPRVLFAPLGEIGHSRADGAVCVPFADAVGKIGFPDATGRVRFRRSAHPDLILDFRVDAQQVYADRCPFQLWMQTDHVGPLVGLDGLDATARLVELEPFSPLTALEPGESVTLTARYSVGGPVD